MTVYPLDDLRARCKRREHDKLGAAGRTPRVDVPANAQWVPKLENPWWLRKRLATVIVRREMPSDSVSG